MSIPTDLAAIVGDAEPIHVVEGGRAFLTWWTDKAGHDDCAYCIDGVCVQRIEWAEGWDGFLAVHNHRTGELS